MISSNNFKNVNPSKNTKLFSIPEAKEDTTLEAPIESPMIKTLDHITLETLQQKGYVLEDIQALYPLAKAINNSIINNAFGIQCSDLELNTAFISALLNIADKIPDFSHPKYNNASYVRKYFDITRDQWEKEYQMAMDIIKRPRDNYNVKGIQNLYKIELNSFLSYIIESCLINSLNTINTHKIPNHILSRDCLGDWLVDIKKSLINSNTMPALTSKEMIQEALFFVNAHFSEFSDKNDISSPKQCVKISFRTDFSKTKYRYNFPILNMGQEGLVALLPPHYFKYQLINKKENTIENEPNARIRQVIAANGNHYLMKILTVIPNSTRSKLAENELKYGTQFGLIKSTTTRLVNSPYFKDTQWLKYYFLMKDSGKDLADSLRENIFSEKHRQIIAIQIIQAIVNLHSHNTAHLDIKPQNFTISTENNKIKITIIDYGFSEELNTHPIAKGTKGYLPDVVTKLIKYNIPLIQNSSDSSSENPSKENNKTLPLASHDLDVFALLRTLYFSKQNIKTYKLNYISILTEEMHHNLPPFLQHILNTDDGLIKENIDLLQLNALFIAAWFPDITKQYTIEEILKNEKIQQQIIKKFFDDYNSDNIKTLSEEKPQDKVNTRFGFFNNIQFQTNSVYRSAQTNLFNP